MTLSDPEDCPPLVPALPPPPSDLTPNPEAITERPPATIDELRDILLGMQQNVDVNLRNIYEQLGGVKTQIEAHTRQFDDVLELGGRAVVRADAARMAAERCANQVLELDQYVKSRLGEAADHIAKLKPLPGGEDADEEAAQVAEAGQ